MKLKDGFILQKIGGQCVVIPTAEDMDLNKMIKLNETGAFLWELLETETDEEALVRSLLVEYEVDEATARRCVESFVGKLREHGLFA